MFSGLGPGERAGAIILAGDFAHAGSLEHLGAEHALPPVFSPHNTYYFWAPEPGLRRAAVIAIGLDEALLRREFAELEEAARYQCPYCMGWRDDLPIDVARRPRRPILAFWPEMKRFGLPTRKILLLDAQARESPGPRRPDPPGHR